MKKIIFIAILLSILVGLNSFYEHGSYWVVRTSEHETVKFYSQDWQCHYGILKFDGFYGVTCYSYHDESSIHMQVSSAYWIGVRKYELPERVELVW